ncbi:glycosyltransferase family 9 protein [Mycolicibacterium chubuense]|uniref:Lipopolysaccharide core heptosyltransferase RfaQ n=1 Tax=Mycolicibacterium chubuense TaxID=1800 RepID=A0A0J6V9H0_MYCCU|nr:glycosyltransferase family 9 protein [Mycolicibacterium chubuense]KMO66859.1 Lipopolysaccharide core heptosyltransferase RfaQ [Mycolicibacterium chubuense]SPX95957.1 transferase [Mycolicibacterium chubuense]
MSTALVARLDSAGDVLITGPAIRAVAQRHDRVVMLAGPRGRAAAELLPGVDEIIEWQAPWVDFDSPELTAAHADDLIKRLRDTAPDRAYIFTSFHQSPLPLALLCRMSDIGWVGAISVDYPGSLLDLRHQVPDGVPEPLRALSLAQAAGCRLPDGDTGALRVTGVGSIAAQTRQRIGSDDFVVFHPGAAVPARRPGAERARAMVAALTAAGHRVVVTGGPDERDLTAEVAAGRAVDLGGLTTFTELAAVLAAARVVVAPNTGTAHLAAAVGTPIVSLFAPVVPASQWAPYGVPVTVLGDQQAPCRATRARTCPLDRHTCLDDITDSALLEAVHDTAHRGGSR